MRKIAKLCPEAQATISMVEDEERRQQEELKRQKKQAATNQQQLQQLQQQQQQCVSGASNSLAAPAASPRSTNQKSTTKLVASNLSVHKRNLWIKCALIEKKLVAIVEHLAANASKYYEPEALMANYVSAQLLCSLLVGPCALEFSRSKTNDFYQFEEPSADELLKRHKLSNPIACLCSAHPSTLRRFHGGSLNYRRSTTSTHPDERHHVSRSLSTSTGGGSVRSVNTRHHERHRQGRLASDNNNNNSSSQLQLSRSHTDGATGSFLEATKQVVASRSSRRRPSSTTSQGSCNELIREEGQHTRQTSSPSPGSRSPLVRKTSGGSNGGSGSGRRRPLALRTNIKTGALVTECHHSACQEISEHQQTRGYSFTSTLNSNGQQPQQQQLTPLRRPSCSSSMMGQRLESTSSQVFSGSQQSTDHQQQPPVFCHSPQSQFNCSSGGCGSVQEATWSAWSPRMLHETLHQNSKSSLLYAKNNVLLETHAHGTIAGYLSLHQTSSSDLILKWIPNELINGGHTQAQDGTCGCQHQATSDAVHTKRHSQPTGAVGSSPPKSATDDWSSKRSASSSTTPASDGVACASGDDGQEEVTAAGARSHSLSTSNNFEQADSISYDLCASRAIGSSYLDLVISLSVSRIVLLHCHFNGMPHSELFGSANEHFAPSGTTNDGGQDQASGQDARPNSDLEETLVLVEADGIQRAPFRFPKGGLRWFLSCMENGLGPDRYLEPAIRPDTDDENNNNNEAKRLADPLQALHSLTWANNGWTPGRVVATSNPNSPSAASEPAGGNSRLEVLLRRLPSLRRAQPSTAGGKARSADLTGGSSAVATDETTHQQVESGTESSTASAGGAPPQPLAGNKWKRPHHARPMNYVYRIVSVHQVDWPQPTPPLSALSVDSTRSGSFLTVGASGKHGRKQHRQRLSSESPGVSQRFSWSLSKLARFSSRTNSTSSSSGGPNGAPSNPNETTTTNTSQSKSALGSLTSLLYLSYNKTTLDSVGSLDSSQQASDLNDNNNNTSSMKRDSSSELIRIEAKLNDLKKSSTEELMVLRTQSIQTLCESMRKQILARAFYGWLVYCRRMKIVRTHLMGLINESRLETLMMTKKSDGCNDGEINDFKDYDDDDNEDDEEARRCGLTWIKWRELQSSWEQQEQSMTNKHEWATRVNRLVYYGGIEDDRLRAQVWPYLLGHYEFGDSLETKRKRDDACRGAFESSARDWVKIERVIKERDNDILEANMAKVARRQQRERLMATGEICQDQQVNGFSSLTSETTDQDSTEMLREDEDEAQQDEQEDEHDQGASWQHDGTDDTIQSSNNDKTIPSETDDKEEETNDKGKHKKQESPPIKGRQRTNKPSASVSAAASAAKARAKRQRRMRRRFRLESTGSVGSDASITDQFGNNIHRIDKDVQRCDRNFWYFKKVENLDKLRKIMCSYVWQHLDVGYVQGMCDLAAPLLVIFDHDELMAYNCFSQLMKRMVANFPHGSAMDQHFEHLKYLMQVLDPKLFEILQNNGDYTHFYFCYRWLLLDFKRELAYEDVYRVWEAIWSARVVATEHFVVFLALAMVRFYRDIIIENNMDFTDTIKFFNGEYQCFEIDKTRCT